MANQLFVGIVIGGLVLSAGLALSSADRSALFPVEYAEGPFDVVSVDRMIKDLSETTKPSITLFYSPDNRRTHKMFPQFVTLAREFQHRDVDIHAYAHCKKHNASTSFGLIRKHKAPFDPLWLDPGDAGELRRGLGKLGIKVNDTITTPFIVVRDAEGAVVLQKESVTGMTGLRERMLSSGLARND